MCLAVQFILIIPKFKCAVKLSYVLIVQLITYVQNISRKILVWNFPTCSSIILRGYKTSLFCVWSCRSLSVSRTLKTMWPLWQTSTPTKTSIRFQRTRPCWKTSTKLFKASKHNLEIFIPSQQVQAAFKICIHHDWTSWFSAVTCSSGAYSEWCSLQKDKTSRGFLSLVMFFLGLALKKNTTGILFVFIWAGIVSCNVSKCSCMHISSVYNRTVS